MINQLRSSVLFLVLGLTAIAYFDNFTLMAEASEFTSRRPVVTASLEGSSVSENSRYKTLITLQFDKVSIATALSMVSKQGGLNLVIGRGVEGDLPSIYLEDVTPEEAVKYIAEAGGLTYRKLSAKTYLISVEKVIENRSNASDSEIVSNESGLEVEGLTILKAPPRSVKEESRSLSTIELKNVKPSFMAYWLDPRNHPEPNEFASERQILDDDDRSSQVTQQNGSDSNKQIEQMKQALAEMGGQPGGFNSYTKRFPQVSGQSGASGTFAQSILPSGGGTVALPEGVDNLIVIDALNALLVRGSDEGIDRLREVIALLDKPIQQVEIEAQFIEVRSVNESGLALSLTNTSLLGNSVGFNVGGLLIPAASSGTISYANSNFTARLRVLLTSGRGKVVNAPRITTFNNQMARISQESTIYFVTTNIITTPGANGTFTTREEQILNRIPFGVSLSVLPTILKDGSINITIRPRVSTRLDVTLNDFTIPSVNSNVIRTSSNVKDGDTLVIGGLRFKDASVAEQKVPFLSKIPIIGSLFRSKVTSDEDTELIIALTARVVRRIDDPIPGT